MWSEDEESFGSEDQRSQQFPSKRKRALREDEGLKNGPENTLFHHCSNLVNSSDSEQIKLEENPINVALHQGSLVVVTRKKVMKMSKDNQNEEEAIYATCEDQIIKDSVFNDQHLVLVIKHKNPGQSVRDNWSVIAIKLKSKKCANKNLLECKSEIKWILPLKGRNLKSSFFYANSIESDVGNEDNLLIVWTDEKPCIIHIHQNKCYNLVRRNLCSKISFLLENVVMSEEKENMESFSDLLRIITTEKKISGFLSEQQITDIKIHDAGYVILLSCGSLIMYDESGKHFLSKQISKFTIVKDCLTAISYDFKIITGSLQDLKQMSKSSIENVFSSVSDISKKVLNMDEMLKTEQNKLDHIKIFSMIKEGENIFEIKLKIEQEDEFPKASQNRLLVDLKLVDNQIKIKQGFFLFKLIIKTSSCSIERSTPVPSMRSGDIVHLNIPLENFNLVDFPVYIEGFLVMQGSKITDSSLGFLYSERILFQEISPLEFLYTKLDGTKETGDEDEVLQTNHSDTEQGSERSIFLSLLENNGSNDEPRAEFSTRVTIRSQSLDKYERLNSLLLQDSHRVVFTFLEQDVEFTAKDNVDIPNENENRDWTIKGCKNIVIMLTKYLKNL